jgi:hypothetical protein
MDMNLVNGILRAVVPAFTAYAAAKGWISANSAGDILAAVLAVSAAVWSIVSNKKPPA